MRVRAVVVGAVTGLAGVSVLVAPSQAVRPSPEVEAAVVADAVGDMGHPADIERVRVKHTKKAVVVRVQHTSLPVDGNQSMSAFFDTDAEREGAEFVLNGGLFLRSGSGQKFTLTHARGWASTGRVANCNYSMMVDSDEGLSRMTVKRACFDKPRRVRVAVRVTGATDGGEWRTDWAGGRGTWTRWLAAQASSAGLRS